MAVLTILALLFSPVIAVCITLWWQNRKEKQDAKRHLFTKRLTCRWSQWPHFEASPACLPRHPAVAYLFLVRRNRHAL